MDWFILSFLDYQLIFHHKSFFFHCFPFFCILFKKKSHFGLIFSFSSFTMFRVFPFFILEWFCSTTVFVLHFLCPGFELYFCFFIMFFFSYAVLFVRQFTLHRYNALCFLLILDYRSCFIYVFDLLCWIFKVSYSMLCSRLFAFVVYFFI